MYFLWSGYSYIVAECVGVCVCVYMCVQACVLACVHTNKSKASIYTLGAFSFFKEKTALGGIRTHDTPRSRRACKHVHVYTCTCMCVRKRMHLRVVTRTWV